MEEMNNNNSSDTLDKPDEKSKVQPELKKTDSSQDETNGLMNSAPEKENTRSKMALLYVLGFFAILFSCFIYAIMVKAKLSELKDTLVGVAGALSGILGFIVGYYYKSSQG